MANINGFGKVGIFDPIANTFQALRTSSVTLTSEFEVEDIQAFPIGDCGPLVTTDSKTGSTTWTAGLALPSVDDNDLALIFDQKWTAGVAMALPDVVVGTVPLTGPYTVPFAGLAVGDTAAANVLNDTAAGVLLTATAGAASATNATKAAGSMTFDASFAGKTVSMYRLATTTPTRIIGGATPRSSYPEISFFGLFCADRMAPKKLYIPRLKRSNGVNFDVTADAFEMEYKVLTPSGWGQPYAIW